jgi:integrase
MGTRKPNGESWISDKPNKDGFYEAKVWMGVRGDGTPDRRNVRRKDEKALRRRVRELERARDAGRVPKAGRPPTVRVMLTRHLNTVLPAAGRSPGTIQGYRSLCKTQIFPRWGAQRADRLTPEDVEDGIAAMLKAGLAPSTVRKVFAILSRAYQVQVGRGNLVRNPCEHVTPPDPPKSDMPTLTEREVLAVLVAGTKRPNGPRWALGLGLGLRQGEALGLRWEFLNLETGEMRVWWQVQRLTWSHGCADDDPAAAELTGAAAEQKREARIAEIEHACAAAHCKTKPCRTVKGKCRLHARACPPPCPAGCTGHASRCPHRRGGGMVLRPVKEKRHKTIWLADEWLEYLRKHRDWQYLQKLAAGEEWEDGDFVFCQWNGRPVDPRRDWAEWGAILSAAGLPRHRVHDMRHTAATGALDEGVALAVVKDLLGHADIRMTERYTHAGKAQSLDASGRMARRLGLSVTERS